MKQRNCTMRGLYFFVLKIIISAECIISCPGLTPYYHLKHHTLIESLRVLIFRFFTKFNVQTALSMRLSPASGTSNDLTERAPSPTFQTGVQNNHFYSAAVTVNITSPKKRLV